MIYTKDNLIGIKFILSWDSECKEFNKEYIIIKIINDIVYQKDIYNKIHMTLLSSALYFLDKKIWIVISLPYFNNTFNRLKLLFYDQ